MSKKKKESNNIRLAGLFIILVFGLIILSVFFKLVFLVKNSKFDGVHNFSLALTGNKTSEVISFSPQNKSISILKINGNLLNKNISRLFKIPVDVTIEDNNTFDKSKISKSIWDLLLRFDKHNDLNIYDVFRLALYSQTIQKNSIYEEEILSNISEEDVQAIPESFFQDPTISQENISIEIVNSTNVYGLGNRLADLITRMGGNVVLVSSEDRITKYSRIFYSDSKNYTVKRLGSFLNIAPEKSSKRGIADVTIIIGVDKLKDLNF